MELDASLAAGPHALLGRLVGRYAGRARLWMMPDALDDDEPVTGSIVAVNGGQFVRHDYATRIGGVDQTGTQLVGCNLGRSLWQVAWADTWHTGTDLMFLDGARGDGDGQVDVRTTYEAAGENGQTQRWGWRTTFEPTDGGVLIRHYNIPPEDLGGEYLAVELAYTRDG